MIIGQKLYDKIPAMIQAIRNDTDFNNKVRSLLLNKTVYTIK